MSPIDWIYAIGAVVGIAGLVVTLARMSEEKRLRKAVIKNHAVYSESLHPNGHVHDWGASDGVFGVADFLDNATTISDSGSDGGDCGGSDGGSCSE